MMDSDQEAISRFYAWVNGEMAGMQNVRLLDPMEAAEMAYRAAFAKGIQRAFELTKPLADPRLFKLAEYLTAAGNPS